MEDYDECLPVPDKNGVLDLRYRGWNTLDDTIWTFGREIISLNIAYNNLIDIPADIGSLKMLKHLDVAFNKIEYLPPELGRLSRLTTLKCSGNKIKKIPSELSRCSLLEEIICTENELTELPNSLATLPNIQVIKVQNNKLKTFPMRLAFLPTVRELDLTYNEPLKKDFPEEWLNKTNQLQWMAKVHQRYQDESEKLKESMQEHEDVLRLVKESKLRLEDQVIRLREENRKLIKERPETYMMAKEIAKKGYKDAKYHVSMLRKSNSCSLM